MIPHKQPTPRTQKKRTMKRTHILFAALVMAVITLALGALRWAANTATDPTYHAGGMFGQHVTDVGGTAVCIVGFLAVAALVGLMCVGESAVTGRPARAFLLPFALGLLALPSCSSTQDTERLRRIGDVALTVAERSGKITPEEAALAREAGAILLSETPPPTALPVVDVTSAK